MNIRLLEIWTGNKISINNWKVFGSEYYREFAEEIQPLDDLMQKYFGESSAVGYCWRRMGDDETPYMDPQVTLFIYGSKLCTGSLLECTRTALQMVQNYLRIK